MSLRRAQSFSGDVFQRPAVEQVLEWQVPREPDDRSYMMLLYQEHAELARQQEYLRALWSAVLLCLAALMLLSARDDSRQWSSGVALIMVGVVGAIALVKHHARYRLHVSVMRSFRMALAETVRSDVSRLSTTVRMQHDRRNRLLGWISLQGVFLLLALAMVGGGAEMVWRSIEADAAITAEPGRGAGPPGIRKPIVALAPASGQL